MAPFDANYINVDEFDLTLFDKFQPGTVEIETCLVTKPAKNTPPAHPHTSESWRKATISEHLLHLLDADAIVTSIVFICVYIGLIHTL